MKTRVLFESVLAQPAIHIGQKSVTRLKAYVDGYMVAMDQIVQSDENFNMDFNKWVSKRFRIQTSHSWADIILFMGGNDETRAFDMTKELWEEYKTETEPQK